MSGPVPLALCDVAVPALKQREHRSDINSDCNDVSYNGHCEGNHGAAVVPATVVDVGLSELKHNSSVIVFGDHDNQENSASETQEFSPSPTEEGANGDGEDAFPEILQFKELPAVSRCCRNMNRNRKVLRKRQDSRPKSFPLDSQNPSSKVKSVFTGSQEQQEPLSNNGKQQVRESVLLFPSAKQKFIFIIFIRACYWLYVLLTIYWYFSEYLHNVSLGQSSCFFFLFIYIYR